MNLNNLEEKIKNLEQNTSELKGKLNTLEDQFIETEKNFEKLNELQILNSKAVELLNIVQKSTKELICNMFETIVTHALQYIHQDNGYEFKLEFDRHGNKPKLKFLLKTPDMQESHDILTTRAGGSKDIIALALRFVLLEISKNKGFLFMDEPFKRLDNEETIEKAISFVKETQKDTKRQLLIITHKDEVINSIENPIIFKKKGI
ncbi:MAG: hypothetical protein ACTSWG_10295 [Candidatus Helarchaeota archaeon]